VYHFYSGLLLATDLHTNLRARVATTFVPGLICVGGIFFLHFGIFTALAFYNLTMCGGVINAMLPAFRNTPQPPLTAKTKAT